jgi:oligoendopeptidase F
MSLPKRNEVPTASTWDLTRIYPNKEAWHKALQENAQAISKLPALQKNLTKDGPAFYQTIKSVLAARRTMEKVYVYASLSSDVDTGNQENLALVAQAQQNANNFETAAAFLEPAILALSDEQLAQFKKEEPQLALYEHFLAAIRKQKEHTLPVKEEELLASASGALQASENTFNVLTNSDLAYPYVEDEDGEMVQLSEGLYNVLIQSKKREVREGAFYALYQTIHQFENSLAATLSGTVKAHNFTAKAHHYQDARTQALAQNQVPTKVYDTLLKEVNSHLDLLHRYVALRKRVLGIKDLKMFDIYVPLIDQDKEVYTLARAKQEAKKALSCLGPDYLKHVDYIFNNRVIDPIETKGKVTGAYSGGSYDTDPYELLNWENDLDSLFTLVHETGHSVHSMYSHETQPYVYGEYPIFLAEIASTTNENILLNYLLDHTADKKKRAFLLNYFLDSAKGTLYRQTQFAEFEQYIHEQDQQGQPLTANRLNDFYAQLNEKYYGPAIETGSEIAMEWARIPHFYYDFYVYQYATGFAAATTLSDKVLHGSDQDRSAYLGFLKSGCSSDPVTIMKKAGVAMDEPAYLEKTFKIFEQRLNELEDLL